MFKLSAEDIVHQTFQRRFRGYDAEQVEEFLELVARQWEQMRSELERARDEVAKKEQQLEEYRSREQNLQDALEMAKRVADEIKEKAEREAELTIADAEVEADRILASVEEEVDSLRENIYALKQQRNRYEAELRSLLNSHLEMLDRMDEPDVEEAIPRAPRAASPEELDDAPDAVEVEESDVQASEPIDENEESTDDGDTQQQPRIRDSHQ